MWRVLFRTPHHIIITINNNECTPKSFVFVWKAPTRFNQKKNTCIITYTKISKYFYSSASVFSGCWCRMVIIYINIIYIYKKWRVRLHCIKLMANRIPIILPSSPVHSSCVNYFHSVFVYTSVHRVLVFVCVWCVTIVSLPNYCCYCF